MKKIVFVIVIIIHQANGVAQSQKQINTITNFILGHSIDSTQKDLLPIMQEKVKVAVAKQIDISNEFNSKKIGRHTFTPLSTSNSSFINYTPSVSLESEFGDQFGSVNSVIKIGNTGVVNLELKQPFEKKPDEVTPFSTDGLETGTSFKAGFQYNFQKLRSLGEVNKIFEKIRKEFYLKRYRQAILCCDTNLITIIKNATKEYYYKSDNKLIKVDSLFKQGCCCKEDGNASIQIFMPKDTQYKFSSIDSANVNSIKYTDFDSATLADFYKQIFIRKWFISGAAGISKKSFDYIPDPLSVTPILDETHLNQNYRATLGYIINSENEKKMSVVGLTFAYSRVFEISPDPEASGNIIFPASTEGNSYMKEVSIGTPALKNKTRVSLEFRRKFGNDKVAISPSFSYLFQSKAYSVILPVYIFQYKKDGKLAGLQGGFRLGYLSKNSKGENANFSEGFKASIFIAAPFDLLSF